MDKNDIEDSNWLTLCDSSQYRKLAVALASLCQLEVAFYKEGIPMADLARKMPESSHFAGFSAGPIELANEKHYSVIEISKLWALSQKTVRRIFEREPGVIHWGSEESRRKRGYRTLRVPETVLLRVHRKLRRAS